MKCRHGSKPVIGIIGAIGAGKSSASCCFEMRGGAVVNADLIGHKALEQANIVEQVVSRWGDRARKSDGSLDRRSIAGIVFANPEERKALEEMVFPFIGAVCKKEIKEALDDADVRFVILDAAVLLEAGWNENVDRIVYVDAPREVRLSRVFTRSGWTEQDLGVREASQWPAEKKKARADAVIMNDASSEELQRQVDQLLEKWQVLTY